MRKLILALALVALLGMSIEAISIYLSFRFMSHNSVSILALTIVAGLITGGLGYASVVILGGKLSLRIAELLARLTRSRHVGEVLEEQRSTRKRITSVDFALFSPILVYILSVVLSWDIHNVHDQGIGAFRVVLDELNIFGKPPTMDSLTYSMQIIPAMIFLVAVAGAIPSVVLSYYRRFKITGVNSGPFHTSLLVTVIGLIVGFGTFLSTMGLVYSVFWAGKAPVYYHYVLPVMLGLSLQYGVGAYIGRERSERMVMAMLEKNSSARVVRGVVNVQEVA
jgi:hypothetical protein